MKIILMFILNNMIVVINIMGGRIPRSEDTLDENIPKRQLGLIVY